MLRGGRGSARGGGGSSIKEKRTNWRELLRLMRMAGRSVCSCFSRCVFCEPYFVYGYRQAGNDNRLLLLVTVLAKTFFTLVSSHLMAFALFSVGHSLVCFLGLAILMNYDFLLFVFAKPR